LSSFILPTARVLLKNNQFSYTSLKELEDHVPDHFFWEIPEFPKPYAIAAFSVGSGRKVENRMRQGLARLPISQVWHFGFAF